MLIDVILCKDCPYYLSDEYSAAFGYCRKHSGDMSMVNETDFCYIPIKQNLKSKENTKS